MMFMECSAKTKENIAKVFEDVAKVILQKVINLEIDVQNEVGFSQLCIKCNFKNSGVRLSKKAI